MDFSQMSINFLKSLMKYKFLQEYVINQVFPKCVLNITVPHDCLTLLTDFKSKCLCRMISCEKRWCYKFRAKRDRREELLHIHDNLAACCIVDRINVTLSQLTYDSKKGYVKKLKWIIKTQLIDRLKDHDFSAETDRLLLSHWQPCFRQEVLRFGPNFVADDQCSLADDVCGIKNLLAAVDSTDVEKQKTRWMAVRLYLKFRCRPRVDRQTTAEWNSA